MDALSQLVSAFPRQFWLNIDENSTEAFGQAHRLTMEKIAEPEQVAMRGQLRHARCEDAFRTSGEACGLEVIAPHTEPAGARYSLIKAEGIYLLRGNIQQHCGAPRATAFRGLYAQHNAWLSPVQQDMLRVVPVPPDDALTAFLVTSAYKPGKGDQTIPAFIGVGIPRADLSGWHRLVSITDIIALYHESAIIEAAPLEVKDRAVPQLKPRLGNSQA